MTTPRITLDQWAALTAVVDAGSYARAAEVLHKTQSTLTYSIKKIEDLLGIEVFRIEGRKAVLTPNGELLYRRGRNLLEEAGQLEDAAAQLARGWEPEIGIAAEILFPTWLLLQCMAAFGTAHPSTRIELIESVLGGTEDALNQKKTDIAITPVVPPGFVGETLMEVRVVCMASPRHPLHLLGRPLTRSDLRRHRHLVIRDSGVRRERSSSWLNEQRWTVTNKATSIRAACMGLGYAWYPEDNVREEVQSGALKPLPLKEGAERFVMLYLVLANGDAAGPGTRELAGIIQKQVRQACSRKAEQPGQVPLPTMANSPAARKPIGVKARTGKAHATTDTGRKAPRSSRKV
jgi:DNA-binding transcriptional LysR family regulator